MNTYGRLSVAFSHGEGCWLYDIDGNKYLDALSGIAVCGLGHAHPAVTQAITEQARKLIHTSNLYGIPLQSQLAEKLSSVSGMDKVFFSNSGAEANECAIKIARLYGHNKGIEQPTIIVMSGSFHGRTLATLSATGNQKIQAGFEPLVQGFARAPFNDMSAVQQIIENNSNVVAVLVEPIQGEGGINIPDAEYLPALRQLCDQHELLLMLDEIQTGNARAGHYFAYQQHSGLLPDVVTTAKGLGNGVPIGACLAKGIAAETLKPGNHGSTFGGNPLACAVGLAVMKTIEDENLTKRATTLGEYISAGFTAALKDSGCLNKIKQQGLLIGLELTAPCTELAAIAKDNGLLINVTAEKVIRLLPPLIMTDDEADLLVEKLSALIKNYFSNK